MSMQEAEDVVVRSFAQVEGMHKDVLRYYEVFKQVLYTGTKKGWQYALDTHVEQFVAFGLLRRVREDSSL